MSGSRRPLARPSARLPRLSSLSVHVGILIFPTGPIGKVSQKTLGKMIQSQKFLYKYINTYTYLYQALLIHCFAKANLETEGVLDFLMHKDELILSQYIQQVGSTCCFSHLLLCVKYKSFTSLAPCECKAFILKICTSPWECSLCPTVLMHDHVWKEQTCSVNFL